MNAARAGRLYRNRHLALARDGAHITRERNDTRERDPHARIQVDEAAIDRVHIGNPRKPWMHLDRPQLHGIEQREQIATDDAGLGTFLHRSERLDAHSVGHVCTGVLLEEDRAANTLWESLEHKRAPIDVWL